jgi:hypothetical protein
VAPCRSRSVYLCRSLRLICSSLDYYFAILTEAFVACCCRSATFSGTT